MTVAFCNHGALDLDAIRLMGVSVKDSRSPIGFFGTGLKFAIATLLRTGHSVRIHVAGREHRLSLEARVVRGEEFQVVCLDGERLGFTTQMGRTWEPWQAYRELASNARDEEGTLVTDQVERATSYIQEHTAILVTGGGIDQAHARRADIFCEAPVLVRHDLATVHRGVGPHLFYRGVRAGTLPGSGSLHVWSVQTQSVLTEDRTLRDGSYILSWLIPRVVSESDDEEFIEACLSASRETAEGRADYDYADSPSEAFMAVMSRIRERPTTNPSAVRLWLKNARGQTMFRDAELGADDEQLLQEALDLVRVLDEGCAVQRSEIRVVATLGPGILGRMHAGQILIARSTLAAGLDMLAGTIWEEYLHRDHGYEDCTATFQNFLVNHAVSLARRLRR